MHPTPKMDLKFKIELLSGKNVVMVNCPGYECELFMPQIVNERITFQNIIPNRRCCPESRMLTDPFEGEVGVRTKTMRNIPLRASPAVNLSTPLAKSTPSSTSSLRVQAGKENLSPQLTPEGVRCRPFRLTSVEEVEMDVDPLNEFLLQGQPSTFLGQPTLRTQLPSYQSENISEASITSPMLYSCSLAKVQPSEPVLTETTAKPPSVRTYIRKKAGTPSKSKPTAAWSPLQKRKKSSAVSSTKAPSPTLKLEVRNRKLIVDSKKTLAAYDPNKIASVPITRKKIIRKQVTGKTRKQFEALKVTAFDLLTNPSVGHMSQDLSKQFQHSCVNKVSTTLPNYAEIAVTSPLKCDRQVKSLMARQRRMDRVNQRPKCTKSLSNKWI
ncbi:uncharacterized protein LOC108101576 [Drosophila ficusphila]|uniref:uncharacterized protein LOC108101576 n=1 Tax=Drosophila ficusphila TaxID=30025 RepID=UPI0007E8A36E|nr:uncharacterized protein LOC108101576 [Drosophila ficusphila]